MNLLKTILITTAVTLPLGFYVSTIVPKPDGIQQGEQTAAAPSVTASVPVVSKNDAAHQQDDDVALLKTEVNGLKAEIAALREAMRGFAKVKSTKEISVQDTDKIVPPSDEAIRAEEEKYFAEQGAALETDFRQQTIDPVWSSEAATLIRKGLASDKISGNAIVSLECRTHTCRLELANNGKNKPPDFIEFPQQIAGELSNMMVSQTESGDDTTVFYLSKEEFVLPN